MATVTSADGVPIAYEVTGDGSPLVLVHGITESRRAWDPLLPALAARHSVVAIDVRGHGESGSADAYDAAAMAGDVAAVVAELGWPDPVVVGHSMGGIVATAYAGLYPCAAVVNIDQSIALGDFQDLVRGVEPMLRSDAFAEVMAGLFDSMHGPLPAGEVARLGGLRRAVPEVVLGVWAPLLELDRADLDALVAGVADAVHVPYLALHGIDPGATYAQWLEAAIPSARVEVWPDHGHYPHLVDHDRFVALLHTFETQG